MNKIITLLCLLFLFLVFASEASAANPNWNITGTWTADHYYLGNYYTHVNDVTEYLSIAYDAGLTGYGGWNGYVNGQPTGGSNTWFITSIPPYESYLSGDSFHMSYRYSSGAPDCRGYVDADISEDGSMTGTWHDNCAGERSGDWTTDFKATRIGNPTSINQCKEDGWNNFVFPEFKNQGDCVSYVQSSPNAEGNKTK